MPDGVLTRQATQPCGCDDAPGLVPVDMARARLLAAASPVTAVERLAPDRASGRILAEAPCARLDLPPFDQAAMDGYGLAAAALHAAATPRVLRRVTAGAAAGPALAADEAVRVLTGAALPAGVAAVVMEEHAALRQDRLRLARLPREGENIRRRGEDVRRGDALAAPGTRLDARHVALFAAAGVAEVSVRRRLRVAVMSSGDELGTTINDSNRPMLRAMLDRPDCAVTDLGALPDDPAAIAAALRRAAPDHDLVLTSGGVSGSDADHLPDAIGDAGGVVETLKLAMKPGKPLAHGRIGGAFILCLPGNPLAALVGMLVLGRPLLAHLAGAARKPAAPLAAIAAEGFARRPGREEYLPACILGHDEAGLPLLRREGRGGSARLLPLSRADGLLWLPADCAMVAAGDPLRFHPFAAAFAP